MTVADIESANKKVKVEIDKLNAQPAEKRRRITYATYTSKDRAAIGKYAAEHGPMATSRYLRRNWGFQYPRHLHDVSRKNTY